MLKKKKIDHERLDQAVSEARRHQELREQGYRELALKLYPCNNWGHNNWGQSKIHVERNSHKKCDSDPNYFLWD